MKYPYTVEEGAVSCAVIVSDDHGVYVSRLSVLFQLVPDKREISIGEELGAGAVVRKLARTRCDSIEIVRIQTPI